MRLYLSGPMRGLPELNYPTFHAAARFLEEAGYTVVNPAALDRIEPVESDHWHAYMRRDLRYLWEVDGVALLPNWQYSQGAQIEVEVAKALGLPVRRVRDWVPESREAFQARYARWRTDLEGIVAAIAAWWTQPPQGCVPGDAGVSPPFGHHRVHAIPWSKALVLETPPAARPIEEADAHDLLEFAERWFELDDWFWEGQRHRFTVTIARPDPHGGHRDWTRVRCAHLYSLEGCPRGCIPLMPPVWPDTVPWAPWEL